MLKENKNKLYKSLFFKDEKLPYLEVRFVSKSNYPYNKHFHDTFSIGTVEEGDVSIIYKNKNHKIQANTLVVINPMVVHACNPIDNQSRTYHMIYLDTQWCKGLQMSLFGNLDSFVEISQVTFEDKLLYKKFIKLSYTLLDPFIFYLEKEEKLQVFLIELFKKYCKIDTIKKAQLYIKENLKDNLTVKQISDYLGISEFYFIKLFKQVTDLTPHAFLLNEKINFAKDLLLENMDLSHIAYELGFVDQSHFNKIFKKLVGATPKEYRENRV